MSICAAEHVNNTLEDKSNILTDSLCSECYLVYITSTNMTALTSSWFSQVTFIHSWLFPKTIMCAFWSCFQNSKWFTELTPVLFSKKHQYQCYVQIWLWTSSVQIYYCSVCYLQINHNNFPTHFLVWAAFLKSFKRKSVFKCSVKHISILLMQEENSFKQTNHEMFSTNCIDQILSDIHLFINVFSLKGSQRSSVNGLTSNH